LEQGLLPASVLVLAQALSERSKPEVMQMVLQVMPQVSTIAAWSTEADNQLSGRAATSTCLAYSKGFNI
jgi:hypothetical protein